VRAPCEPELRAQAEAALRGLDRRAFLRALGGAAALGLLPASATGCGGIPPALAPPPDLALRALTPRTYAVLGAVTRSVVGPAGAALIEAGALDPAHLADELLADAPALAAPLGPALLALELGVWPLLGKLRPFTALAPRARDAILDECMRSRLALKRRLFAGVRAVALLAFWSAPEAHALAHLPGALGVAGVPGVPPVGIEEAMRYDAT
jgi:hypothetical protein